MALHLVIAVTVCGLSRSFRPRDVALLMKTALLLRWTVSRYGGEEQISISDATNIKMQDHCRPAR